MILIVSRRESPFMENGVLSRLDSFGAQLMRTNKVAWWVIQHNDPSMSLVLLHGGVKFECPRSVGKILW
jgi:hypothetical protein